MKKTLHILLAVSLFFSSGFTKVSNPDEVDTNAKIKAVFIYNFMKNIDWPTSYKSKVFTIGILGDNKSLSSELNKMSEIKKIANQSFTIVDYKNINEIEVPHILCITYEESNKIEAVVTKLKGKSTLIVTEKPGMAKKGAAINFVVIDSRQNFELNKNTIQKHNLKVSTTLKNLAIMVN